MMARGAATRSHASKAALAEQSPSDVRCACSISQKDSSFLLVTHSDIFFDLPRTEPAQGLPALRYHGNQAAARVPLPDAGIPDPPPKALTA